MTDETLDDFLDDDMDDIPEIEEPKLSFKDRLKWCLPFLGKVILAIIPAIITALVNKKEYKDYIYTTDQDGVTYKLPAKEMHSIKGKRNRNVQSDMQD